MSGVFAALPATDGPRKGNVPSNSAGMGSVQVRKAEGSDRPNYGTALIYAADRRHDTDPAIRKHNPADDDWI